MNDGSHTRGGPTEESQRCQRLITVFILLVSFFGAFAVRLYNINSAKLYFSSTSQYESFCVARKFYFDSIDTVADWRKQVARANNEATAGRQPLITEYLVSLVYRATGGESHWAPSLVSSVFWLIGGIFVFLTARKFTPSVAAAFATAFYLFAPFGILMSRSIQGESLMTMMFTAGVYFIFTYYEKQSTRNLLFAGVVCGVAILSKVNIVFSIWGVFLAGGICKRGVGKSIFSYEHFFFVLLGIIPGFIYYGWGILFTDKLGMIAESIYAPGLLLYPYFWTGWLSQLGYVVGYICLAGIFAGILIVRDNLIKSLLIGLVVGYFFYGLIFTYTTATHDYYQVQILPIAALGLSPVIALFLNVLVKKNSRFRRVTLMGVLLFLIVFGWLLLSIKKGTFHRDNKHMKQVLYFGYNCFGLRPKYLSKYSSDYPVFIERAEKIGQAVNHSDKTITLASSASPLWYYGEYAGHRWPLSRQWPFPDYISSIGTGAKWSNYQGLSAEELFERHFSRFSPEYFIVGSLEDFEKQESLQEFLYGKFELLVKEEKYLIFCLTKPKQ